MIDNNVEETLIHGTVIDAGGQIVTIHVDSDTLEYPEVGAHVRLANCPATSTALGPKFPTSTDPLEWAAALLAAMDSTGISAELLTWWFHSAICAGRNKGQIDMQEAIIRQVSP